MGSSAIQQPQQKRPSSPLLCKALNETFDEAFGGTVTTPKSRSGTFGEREKSSPLSSSGSLASLVGIVYQTSTFHKDERSSQMTSSFNCFETGSTQRLVNRMKHLSNVSARFMEESLSALQRSNEKLQSRMQTFVLAFPILILTVAQLSQFHSTLLDALVVAAVLPAVWKLLPIDWKDQKVTLAKAHYTKFSFMYHQRMDELRSKVTAFRHETLGWYTSTEIQSLQKDLQHMELHLQETKRQLVRCQHQYQAEQQETSEWQEQQLSTALETAEREHQRMIEILQEDHLAAIKGLKDKHEAAIQNEMTTISTLRRTLQGQETLLLEERRKTKAMKESIETLEGLAQRDAALIDELKGQIMSQQRSHDNDIRKMQASYEHAWNKAKEQKQAFQTQYGSDLRRLQTMLLQHHLRHHKLNRLLCQLLIVADDTNHYFFEDCDDLASIQDKGKVLQEAIAEAGKYVAELKKRTKRDESLSIPVFQEQPPKEHEESLTSSSSVVSELTIQEREAILEVLSKEDYYDSPNDDTAKFLRRSCMILLATAGLTTVAASSPRTLASLFVNKKQ
ncbi:hypothetical protein IV203_034331 [Nitzschia inconspicua]|uniref:Uncharacterized protein n=1 Tax=Nitzschia inconspicua TaxID=303405 RepID=A0A9K3M434_9STRA|nr:hypothetical protein IV203_034331 [Nitzschia inconspicua]